LTPCPAVNASICLACILQLHLFSRNTRLFLMKYNKIWKYVFVLFSLHKKQCQFDIIPIKQKLLSCLIPW